MNSADKPFNIPQLCVLFFFGALIVRWWINSSKSKNTGSNSPIPQVMLDRVSSIRQMFPQVDRRSILWDLQQNGGDVSLTAEKIITRGTLDPPPQSFQPTFPPSNDGNTEPDNSTNGSQQTTTSSSDRKARTKHVNLIERYNLESKLESDGPKVDFKMSSSGLHSTAHTSSNCWSSNKNVRASLLQQRREAMVLAARSRLMNDLQGKTSAV